MKHSILALSLVFCFASTSFAAWNIDCHGENESHLLYSTSSFSGKPLLNFISNNFQFNLLGDEQIHLAPSAPPGKIFVSGNQNMGPAGSRESIRFLISEELIESQFEMNVYLELTGCFNSRKETILMSCTAKPVVY